MMVSAEHEPKLCPDCPRKSFLNMVRAQSYTTTPAIDSVVKQCARLRALDLPHVPQCPYFSDKEKITNFFDCKSEEEHAFGFCRNSRRWLLFMDLRGKYPDTCPYEGKCDQCSYFEERKPTKYLMQERRRQGFR